MRPRPGSIRSKSRPTQGSENLGTNHTSFQVQDRPVEFYNAALSIRDLLQSVASSTGGRYYPLSKIGRCSGRRPVRRRRNIICRAEGIVGRAVPLHAALHDVWAANGSGERRRGWHEGT